MKIFRKEDSDSNENRESISTDTESESKFENGVNSCSVFPQPKHERRENNEWQWVNEDNPIIYPFT